MRIVQKKFEVVGPKGTVSGGASITLFRIVGLKIRKPVPVLKKK